MEEQKFCFGYSEELFHGSGYESRGAAIEAAKRDNPEATTIYTGIEKRWQETLRLGDSIVEMINDQMYEDCGIDDVAIEEIHADALNKVVLDWIEEHAPIEQWTVVDIEKHEVVAGEQLILPGLAVV